MRTARSSASVARVDVGLPGQLVSLSLMQSRLREIDNRLSVGLASIDRRLSDASAHLERQIEDLRRDMVAHIESATGLSEAQIRAVLS